MMNSMPIKIISKSCCVIMVLSLLLISFISGHMIHSQNDIEAKIGEMKGKDPYLEQGKTRILEDYRENLNAQYSWIDITGTGSQLSLTDDDYQSINMGINFNFYDQTYTSVHICSNGYLAFVDNNNLWEYSNSPFPTVDHPFMISPLWDDLNPGNGGSIWYDTLSNPSRFVVSWEAVPHYPSDGSNTFQVILFEGSGIIKFQYQALHAGNSPTVGLNHGDNIHYNNPLNQNPATPSAMQFYLIIPPIPDNLGMPKEDLFYNTCFAGLPYNIGVALTTYEGLNDIDDLKLLMDYNTTNISIGFDGNNELFYKENDPSDMMALLNDCDYHNDGVDKWWLNFSIMFNFNFPHERPIDIKVISLGNCGMTETFTFSNVMQVENDFEFTGVPKMTGEFAGNIQEDDWVRGDEGITLEDLRVNYEGAESLFPDDDLFDVRLWDTQGNEWWDNGSSGRDVLINFTTRNVVDENEEINIKIVNIPGIGACQTNITFPLKVDGEAPSAPEEVLCHAYGRVTEYTNEPGINVSWDQVADNGSGLSGYYYSRHNYQGTPNGSFTELTEGMVRSMSEGWHEIFVWCEDNVGNIGLSNSAVLQVDLTDPMFSNSTPDDGIWHNSSKLDCSIEISDLGGTGVDGESIFYSLSTAGPNQFSAWIPVWVSESAEKITPSVKCSFEEGDDNYIKWRAMDVSENGFVESLPFNVKVDVSPIEFSEDITPSLNWFTQEEITIEITAGDDGGSKIDHSSIEVRFARSGLSGFGPWIKVNEGNITEAKNGECKISVAFMFSEGKDNHIQFRGTDGANNPKSESEVFDIKVDHSPVYFGEFELEDIDEPPEAEFTLEIFDDESGVNVDTIEYSISTEGSEDTDFGDWKKVAAMDIFPGTPVIVDMKEDLDWGRDNYIRFKADDNVAAGPVTSKVYRINITSTPEADILPLGAIHFKEGDVINFDGTGSADKDGDVITYRWESNLTGPLGNNSTIQVILEPGNHTITLFITDVDGNTATDDVIVDIAKKKEDKGGGLFNVGGGSGGGFGWWWWIIIIAVAILLILILIFVIIIVRRKRKKEEEQAREPEPFKPAHQKPGYTPGPRTSAPGGSVPYPAQNFQARGASPQQASPGPQTPLPQPLALPELTPLGPEPSSSPQLPPPAPDGAPQYSLPAFSTQNGEQDLNRMALPPAPDENLDDNAEGAKDDEETLKPLPPEQEGKLASPEAKIPPKPTPPESAGPDKPKPPSPEKPKKDSLDDVFGMLENLVPEKKEDGVKSAPESKLPAPPEKPSLPKPPTPEPNAMELNLQCHECGGDYIAMVEKFPVLVTCPHCGVEGEIEGI